MESQLGDPQSPGPVDLPNGKRRWRRNRVACDSCHTRRVRCDRAFPCSRCLRSEVHCEFTRERRKRGRIARSKLATGSMAPDSEYNYDHAHAHAHGNAYARKASTNGDQKVPAQPALSPLQQSSPESAFPQRSPGTNNLSLSAASVDAPPSLLGGSRPHRPGPEANANANATEEWLSGAHLSPESYDILGGVHGNEGPLPRLFDIWNPVDLGGHHPPQRPQRLPSISAQTQSGQGPPSSSRSSLKYPVLEPIMPFLESSLPRRLVCDLLELYFTSAFSTHMHPVCHHIHCYVLRKASFLSTDRPRPSSPALLASMLWVAAVDDRAFSLSISPLQRRKICQFLCALTIRLLRPLIHVSFKDQESPENPNAPQELPTAAVHHPFEGVGDDKGLVGPAGSLDDVITYIHVASIISSSEQKAASMRWYVLPLSTIVSPARGSRLTRLGGTRLSLWRENSS